MPGSVPRMLLVGAGSTSASMPAATLAMFGFGLLGAAAARRKRKA